jgi:hypothetical protein
LLEIENPKVDSSYCTEWLFLFPVSVTSICGIVYALLAGCPLVILGVTGPLLLYDEVRGKSTFNFRKILVIP